MKNTPTQEQKELQQDLDLHLYETDRRNLATLQKYLIVNNILTIDDLAVLTDGFMTNGHSDKVRDIAHNCLNLDFDLEHVIVNNNVLEGDEPRVARQSKVYDDCRYKLSNRANFEAGEINSYEEFKMVKDREDKQTLNLREIIAQKKKAASES